MNTYRLNLQSLSTVVRYLPRFIPCPVCNGKRFFIRLHPSPRVGWRCLFCRGTLFHLGTYRVIQDHYGPDLSGLKDASVYELSAHGTLYTALKGCATRIGFTFQCSEWFAGVPFGESMNGIRCENVHHLSFSNASFDLITSTAVFEHVEDDMAGFKEICRVLKPGGRYIFTVPCASDRSTITRAVRLPDGTIKHFEPPHYHTHPLQGRDGVFVWRDYGIDIGDRLRAAGFYAAEVVLERFPSLMPGQSVPVIVAQRTPLVKINIL